MCRAIVQVLCSYSTLPLYAIVSQVSIVISLLLFFLLMSTLNKNPTFTSVMVYYKLQMGSRFKPSVFEQFSLGLISNWVGERRRPDSSSHSELTSTVTIPEQI